MARLTLSYGAAQILAPAITGAMAQASGHFKGGLWLTAAVMTVGLVLLASLPKDLAGLTWVDGIGLIYRKMMSALESEGVQPIEALNQRFDPQLHEAVMSGPGEENVVVAELQRGYTLHGAVIRPAMVKVRG